MANKHAALLLLVTTVFVYDGSSHEIRSHFRQRSDSRESQSSIMALMQRVLCRNFPDVPCDVIARDNKLKSLINLSIKQINSKLASAADVITPENKHYKPSAFPRVDRERINENYNKINKDKFKSNVKTIKRKRKKINSTQRLNKKGKKTTKRKLYTGSRKLTKFFPHKKYIDKDPMMEPNEKQLSTSNENIGGTRQFVYTVQPKEAPLWKMDYTKKGELIFDEELDKSKSRIAKHPNLATHDIVPDHADGKRLRRPHTAFKNKLKKFNSEEISSNMEH